MSTLTRATFQSDKLGNTDGVHPLADNTNNGITAEDLRGVLQDLSDSATFRKVDAYVRYAVTVSGTNDITVTLTDSYPDSSYSNAIPIRFQAQADSTGDVRFQVNSLGLVNMYKENQTRVGSGDLVQNSFYECVFNSDADGSGTDGFTLYEGIGGSVAPSVVQVTGTTQTVDAPNAVYVFTGSSACTVTIDTSAFTVGQGFKWINMGSASCSLSANSGTVKLSDPFFMYEGDGNDFVYTGITSYEWCAV